MKKAPSCFYEDFDAAGAVALIAMLAVAMTLSGCVPLPASKPKAEVKSIQSGTNTPGAITPTTLQAKVMRFADEYSLVVAQAAEDFAANVGTTEARYVATRIKLGQATAAVVNATGQNPTVNALD